MGDNNLTKPAVESNYAVLLGKYEAVIESLGLDKSDESNLVVKIYMQMKDANGKLKLCTAKEELQVYQCQLRFFEDYLAGLNKGIK